LIFDETLKELWNIIEFPKAGSKEKAKPINLILSVTKERHLILEKEIDIIETKACGNLVGHGLH
jgi:hypothetical protein